jgi:Methane oxygenase PmoA
MIKPLIEERLMPTNAAFHQHWQNFSWLRTVAALCLLASLTVQLGAQTVADSTGIRVDELADGSGWNIYVGDELLAGYLKDSHGKPIIYPLNGPGGQGMTRNFPMKDAGPDEKTDHDHQRSMWLTHGEVNGIDFWLDDEHCGKIVQVEGVAKVEGDAAVIVTKNDWIGPDGTKILADTRRFAFRETAGRRIIDCDFLLKADYGDVNFGDTKEGSFGVRVAGTMKVEAKKGGLITNAEGDTDKDAWGKKSAWVNYSGPVDGQTVGITIHDHPSSFGYPCRWHVRTYGLFAANPFGVYHFTGGEKTNGIVLPKGKSMRLNYRMVLYAGDFDAAKAAEDSTQFANDPRPVVE